MPLRHTRVIHPRWRDHYDRAVLGGMTARVRLSKPARLGTRDPVSGATPEVPPAPYWEGPGRVQARGGAGPAENPAEREITVAPFLVAVPVDLGGAVPEIGDVVDVLDADDPLLPGARLFVTEVPAASIVLQRNLGADRQAPTTPRRG
ncbi:DUF6093 family protein [Micromonospora sp. RP3T]|uniref:DUF6093 family protein n=1 Tax=Micromonospora sp. RP3T TaxID=2135446 RepID=UPI003D71982B